MATKEISTRREFGNRVRAVRVAMGLDRHGFGKLLGIKDSTMQGIELGHQNMGPAARAAFERIEASPVKPESVLPAPVSSAHNLRRFCELAVDSKIKARAEAVVAASECSPAEALEFVIQRELQRK